MGLLNRSVLAQIAVPSLLAMAVIGVVAVANEIQQQVLDLPVAQVTVGDISRLVFYLLPILISYVVPIMYMMGILLAFGRLSQHGEIVAMKAAGIPLKRVIWPVIAVGAALSVSCFWVQDRVQPWAIGRVYELVVNDLPFRVTLDVLRPGVVHEFRGWRVYIGRKDHDTNTLHDVVILEPGDGNKGSVVYHADSARLIKEAGRPRLEMRTGYYIPSAHGNQITPVVFETFSCATPEIARQIQLETRRGMTVWELYLRQKQLEEECRQTQSEFKKGDLKKERQEIAERLSLPFACLAVSIVAAPLGARAKRSGRSYTFAVGFTIILAYYVLKLLMEPRSLHTLLTVVLRAWVPNFALCVAGLFFVWRVDRV